MDQIAEVKAALGDFPILSNGNVITTDDVTSNLAATGADGIMSAEGILDNPALFLPAATGLPPLDEVQGTSAGAGT